MKLDAKPTARPWSVERKREVCSADNDMFTVAYASGANQDEAEANAALIVHAINAHDALVAAAKDALEDVTGPITTSGIKIRFSTRDQLVAALALTEGQK